MRATLLKHKIVNRFNEIMLKKNPFWHTGTFFFPMSNLQDQYAINVSKKEIFEFYPLVRHALHNLISDWFDTRYWSVVYRELCEDKILLKRDGYQWIFDITKDNWTTLSGIFKAAQLKVPIVQSKKGFIWSDGKVVINLRDRFMLGPDVSTIHEVFYDEVYKLPVKLNWEEYSVIDIGGYIGESALWFVKQGSQEVHVYEPIPLNYEILQHNLNLNKNFIETRNSEIIAYQEGIYCERGIIEVPYWGGPGTSIEDKRASERKFRVKVSTIVDVFERVSKPIGVVKMDCEGCEYHVFTKDVREILKRPKAYIVEVHGQDKQILHVLSALGYNIVEIVPQTKKIKIVKAVKD